MARRTRRNRDVPRELHRRIEQLERQPLHPQGRTGQSIRDIGLLQPIDNPPVAGWGWAGVLQGIPRSLGNWGWGDNVGSITGTIASVDGGWGWAGDVFATEITGRTTADADDLFVGPLVGKIDAGWGWADKVSATQQQPGGGGSVNASEVDGAELNG